MSTDLVRARVAAVRQVADALFAFEKEWSAGLTTARGDLTRATTTAQVAAVSASRALWAATRRREEAELELRRADPPGEGLRAALRRAHNAETAARQANDRTQSAVRRIDVAAGQLAAALRSSESAVAQHAPPARAHVLEYAEALQAYLAVGGGR